MHISDKISSIITDFISDTKEFVTQSGKNNSNVLGSYNSFIRAQIQIAEVLKEISEIILILNRKVKTKVNTRNHIKIFKMINSCSNKLDNIPSETSEHTKNYVNILRRLLIEVENFATKCQSP